jgi:hypothetical protein
VRFFVITLGACLLGFGGLTEAGGQGALTQSHTVAVKSNPPGATIWRKDGRDFTCTNVLTPGLVDLSFHGDMDVQRLKLKRFGYAPKVLDFKSTDQEVNAELDPKNYETSFLLTGDATPELIRLNDALRTEFGRTLLFDQEAFRCAPFDLYFIHLTQDKETGATDLNVALRLDRSFGGTAFRLASHSANSQERQQKMGQAALENGMGEVLARFHRIAAKFPELKVITVLGFYYTTEAVLDTERVSSMRNEAYVDHGLRLGIDGNMHYNTLQMRTVQTWNDETVVKDQTVERAITFVMPAAKIPDSLDKKTISDAVFAEGQVILAGNIAENSDPGHAIVRSAGGGSGASTVNIFRKSSVLGMALKPSISCDGVELAHIQNGRYFRVQLKPGRHVFLSKNGGPAAEINAEPGGVYFIQAEIMEGGALNLIVVEDSSVLHKLKALDANQVLDHSRVAAKGEIPDNPTDIQ